MRTATLTNQDLRIQEAVLRQLDWDPQVDAAAVGVTAKDHTKETSYHAIFQAQLMARMYSFPAVTRSGTAIR